MSAIPLLTQFRLSAAMRPYVLRVRLRGTNFDFGSKPEQAAAYTKCIGEMRRILLKKGRVSTIAADRAISKTLEAAFDFQLAALRYRFLKRMEAQSHTTLDHLVRLLRQLSHAMTASEGASGLGCGRALIPRSGLAPLQRRTGKHSRISTGNPL
jgi:hypothetical protein